MDLPLTLIWPDDTSVALTEASLRHYAGMALMRPAVGVAGDPLVAQLTPRADGTKVVKSLPMQTPWRVAHSLDGDGKEVHRLLRQQQHHCPFPHLDGGHHDALVPTIQAWG